MAQLLQLDEDGEGEADLGKFEAEEVEEFAKEADDSCGDEELWWCVEEAEAILLTIQHLFERSEPMYVEH